MGSGPNADRDESWHIERVAQRFSSTLNARFASSATLALKSGEWFFRFVIWDHFFHKLIHLNYWSEILRPPL
jgi:hypothetical protein